MNGSRKLVACSYMRKGNHLGFRLGAYDRAKPLVIDPILEYSTYLGGSYDLFNGAAGQDYANAIAVDKYGNAYVTGWTYSTDFPTKHAFQTENEGASTNNSDAFVSKFDPTGHLVYSTYLGGGDGGQAGNAIAVDARGNAYVTGWTNATDFPIKNPFQSTLGFSFIGVSNAFVTKFDPAGSGLVYSTFLGGSYYDVGNGIALDEEERAYVTGFTQSTDFPLRDAFQSTLKMQQSAFVTKFDAAGNKLIYSTYLGGSTIGANGDYGSGIAVDQYGDVYVAGFTASTDFPIKKAFQEKLKSANGNAFITKFDPAGTELIYSTYLGGSCGDRANGIALDSRGSAYVTGATCSDDFPTKNPLEKKLKNRYGNAFVTRFDPAGNELVYSTYLGGSGIAGAGDAGNGIAVDHYGNAYVTGSTVSSDFPIKNPFQKTLSSRYGNAFVTKINPAGCAFVYSSYLGGSGSDSGSGIAVDPAGSAHVTGYTNSSDFPVKNAFQSTLKSPNGNAFVTKISAK